ncbi:zinc-binding dehydrogenase, partial [bacterium]|nr:zinc-binding dehydrogenase [bacterium]
GGEAGPFQIGDMVHGPMIHADYQICQVKDCYPLLWMRKEFSTFIEQGAYALRWVRQARIRYGDTVNIVGMGAVGLMALQHVLANGALHVVSVDPLQDRLKVATRLGAHQVLTDREAAEMSERHGAADAVLDFSGADAGLELACRLAKSGGELLPGAGHYSRKSIQYARDICRQQGIGYKEGGSEPKQKLTELTRGAISSKRVIVWPIISDYVSFHEMEPVYSKLADSPGSYLKVILTY